MAGNPQPDTESKAEVEDDDREIEGSQEFAANEKRPEELISSGRPFTGYRLVLAVITP